MTAKQRLRAKHPDAVVVREVGTFAGGHVRYVVKLKPNSRKPVSLQERHCSIGRRNMSTTYSSLDAMILVSIESGRSTFGAMYVGDVARECKRLGESLGVREDFRVLDRRIQALRRAGRIMYQDGRWSVVKSVGRVGPEEDARMRAFAKPTNG
ncbi:hypothetical protein L0Z02_29695 (plasmid) [Burkholderia multivorans]|uniref:Uncharacterized protein n=1 Tax=Burkholderia multivorans TaxID=87883 RepID=A0AAP2HSI2_9BURK|nr:hypothetical protein [Burkholderia multivorans]MBU9360769.1 hypothetical protein [Burkholderia multivorans]MCO1459887.1 hypothetical protein [Burkholderia multivorans]UQO21298.1 hypothetical protein L0Z02_29695 [Burkholderia multivorans]HEM7843230.1 hypothetical protein [Burkholderia multivorans]HEM7908551.1 hypothetical protein [Burkholderia multivorans]